MSPYPNEGAKLDPKLDELFPKGDTSHAHPDLVQDMVSSVWSSGIDRLTRRLRQIDQARIKSAGKAWTKGVM